MARNFPSLSVEVGALYKECLGVPVLNVVGHCEAGAEEAKAVRCEKTRPWGLESSKYEMKRVPCKAGG
ncbi:hypothetical protein [Pontibacter ummariensis]|uniref:hypothetical protein n=1 Tax=Pontibacter ummariensis TaxID=1610492 RepID=UPI000B78A37C|nr:hypothetical protein [Pontibacter ummariensis]